MTQAIPLLDSTLGSTGLINKYAKFEPCSFNYCD